VTSGLNPALRQCAAEPRHANSRRPSHRGATRAPSTWHDATVLGGVKGALAGERLGGCAALDPPARRAEQLSMAPDHKCVALPQEPSRRTTAGAIINCDGIRARVRSAPSGVRGRTCRCKCARSWSHGTDKDL